MEWILQIPALIFSVVIHEFSHGYMAWKRGDDTAYIMGRLTLNPIPHLDFIGSFLIPMISILTSAPVIGWARPVPVNPYMMYDREKSMIMVAAAGPLSNMIVSVASAFLLTLLNFFSFSEMLFFTPIIYLLKYLVIINLVLAFFNLFPLYPLDGGQIVLNLLPYKLKKEYEKIIPYGMYIIIFLVITGIIKFWVLLPLSYTLKLYKILGLSV